MFEIIRGEHKTKIRLTRGDSAMLLTEPSVSTDINESPIILADEDYVVFTLASTSGQIYITKILTKDNYDENGILYVKLTPSDTKDLRPCGYRFSFAYMPQKGTECYTYDEGWFHILPAISTVDTLNEYLTPESAVPDTPNTGGTADNSEDNIPDTKNEDGSDVNDTTNTTIENKD